MNLHTKLCERDWKEMHSMMLVEKIGYLFPGAKMYTHHFLLLD